MNKQQINFKDDWQEIELKKLGLLIMGQSPKGDSYNDQKKGVALLNGAADLKDNKIAPKQFTTAPTKLAKEGDVLFCIRATIGKSIISDGEYCLGRGVAGFRANSELLSESFLVKILDQKLAGLVLQGSTIRGVRARDIELLKIPIPFKNGKPDLKEQERIAKLIDQIKIAREKRALADKKTKEYLQSVFNNILLKDKEKLKEVKLGEVCYINPKKSEIVLTDKNLEVSFVPMADLQEHKMYFKVREIRKVSEVYSGYTYFREKDILLAKVTPCFENGKSGIATNLKNNIGFGSSEYHVLRPSDKILAEVVYHFISGEMFISNGQKKLTGTGGLRRLPKDYISNFKIPLPPIPLQEKFAKLVEKVERLREKQQKSKEKIDEIFESLIQKAFKGGLTR